MILKAYKGTNFLPHDKIKRKHILKKDKMNVFFDFSDSNT